MLGKKQNRYNIIKRLLRPSTAESPLLQNQRVILILSLIHCPHRKITTFALRTRKQQIQSYAYAILYSTPPAIYQTTHRMKFAYCKAIALESKFVQDDNGPDVQANWSQFAREFMLCQNCRSVYSIFQGVFSFFFLLNRVSNGYHRGQQYSSSITIKLHRKTPLNNFTPRTSGLFSFQTNSYRKSQLS